MCQINVHPDLFNTFLTTAVAVMYMHLYLCSWKLMYYQNKLPGLHTALFVCCSSLSGLALVFRCSNSPKASRSDVPTVQKPHVQMFQQSQSLTFRCSNSPKASRSTAPAPLHITAPLRCSNSPKASRSDVPTVPKPHVQMFQQSQSLTFHCTCASSHYSTAQMFQQSQSLTFRCSNSPKASRSDVPTVPKPHVLLHLRLFTLQHRSDVPTVPKPHVQMFQQSQNLTFRCSNSPKASRSDVPAVPKPHVQMFQQSQSLTFRCSNSSKASRSTAPAPLHITAPPSDQQPLCSVFSAAVNPPLQFIFSILITSKRRQGTDLNRLM